MKNTRVLVTGCAGFIPSYVAENFVKSGAFVYGVDDLSTGSKDNMQTFGNMKNFSFAKGDVLDLSLIESILKKVDFVYHGAIRGIGQSTKNPIPELEVNTKSTILLLELMRKYKIKRFVYPSSASVYGNQKKMPESEGDRTLPTSPYGVSKLAAEQYCLVYQKLFHIPVVCLRYFNTYGPRQRSDSTYGGVVSIFIDSAIKNNPLLVYGNGNQTRDFTYIEDNIAATMKSFTARGVEGSVINISAGKEYSVNTLAQMIVKIANKKNVRIKHVGKRLVDNINRRFGDISLAKKMLNYNPKTSLNKGLEKTYEAYK